MRITETDNHLTWRIYHSPNIVNLCMDSYGEERQDGRLYHQYISGSVPFSSLFEAFDRMEQLYDKLQFPEASTKLRSFQADRKRQDRSMKNKSGSLDLPEQRREEVKKMESFDKVTEHRGKDATFLIRVKYRQNSSWQGEVVWVDKQKKEYFRSALELVRLIDSALEKENN